MTERFKIYNKETLDTYIEDTMDCYSDGTPKTYWFGENEDFCDLFNKLNKLSEENEQLKQQCERHRSNFRAMEEVKCELAEENEQLRKTIERIER